VIGPLVLVAVLLLTVFVPRITGIAVCCSLLNTSCTAAAHGDAWGATMTLLLGIMIGALPFYMHHWLHKDRRSSPTP
jgi:hypothetical protein